MASKSGSKKNHQHHRRGFTLPLAVVAGFSPAVVDLWSHRSSLTTLGQETAKIFTGWDTATSTFHIDYLKTGLLPVVLGVGAHKLASLLGINRMIASTGIPVVRI